MRSAGLDVTSTLILQAQLQLLPPSPPPSGDGGRSFSSKEVAIISVCSALGAIFLTAGLCALGVFISRAMHPNQVAPDPDVQHIMAAANKLAGVNEPGVTQIASPHIVLAPPDLLSRYQQSQELWPGGGSNLLPGMPGGRPLPPPGGLLPPLQGYSQLQPPNMYQPDWASRPRVGAGEQPPYMMPSAIAYGYSLVSTPQRSSVPPPAPPPVQTQLHLNGAATPAQAASPRLPTQPPSPAPPTQP